MLIGQFTSRNKDNQHIDNFKSRNKVFLFYEKDLTKIKKDFDHFVNQGLIGELCRFYISINKRDVHGLHKSLQHYLIDNNDVDFVKFNNKLVSLANQYENRLGDKWLFDVDSDQNGLNEFLNYLETVVLTHKHNQNNKVTYQVFKTVSGFSVVTNHGFYLHNLLEKFSFAELKKDGNLLHQYKTKEV